MNHSLLQKKANAVRFLAADMVQAANSGHPGAPMGLADIVTVLSEHLRHNPKNPKWLNRDRLVYSVGHASALVYSMLYFWGYGLTLDELKNFRQLGSNLAGHPEYGYVAGVEITTGPLGQGIANAVGMAMAQEFYRAQVGDSVNHKVYCLCGDGDLQEGISYEACSVAGHHKLKDLVLIYDSNNMQIEGEISRVFSEDVPKRFQSQNWAVVDIDGHDYAQIERALSEVQNAVRPTIIIAKTTIAKGSLSLSGSHKSHGAPLGEEEIINSKKALGLNTTAFSIDEEALQSFRQAVEKGAMLEKKWEDSLSAQTKEQLQNISQPDFDAIKYPVFETGSTLATRVTNGQILNAIAKAVPSFLGGSADLASSNNTELKGEVLYPKGRNMSFGVREHSMSAIANGMAVYANLLPYTGTFFVFSDYLKPACRLAALMKAKQFYIWTHDSIGVGEDGPTHQPVEHLSGFRALPNFYVFRPADGNENIACWKQALKLNAPSAFVLSRQNLPNMAQSKDVNLNIGAYVIADNPDAKITLVASGSEVAPCIEAALEMNARVVSVPCFDLALENKEKVQALLSGTKNVAVEAAHALEWSIFVDEIISMQSFGASGKGAALFKHFGFTKEDILSKVKSFNF